MASRDRTALYRLAFDEALRVIEFQRDVAAEHATTAGSMVRVGLGSLAAILVAVGLLVNARAYADSAAAVGLGTGIVLNVLGVGLFVRAFSDISGTRALEPGPRIEFVIGMVLEPDTAESDYYLSILRGMPRHVRANEAMLHRMSLARTYGTKALFLAMVGYLATFSYIGGGLILA